MNGRRFGLPSVLLTNLAPSQVLVEGMRARRIVASGKEVQGKAKDDEPDGKGADDLECPKINTPFLRPRGPTIILLAHSGITTRSAT